MRTFRFKSLILLAVIFGAGCAASQPMYLSAPSALSTTRREMKTAGFWIGQHPSPDQIVMTADEIRRFNRKVQDELKLTKDILTLPEFSGPELVTGWQESLNKMKMAGYYLADGRQADDKFFAKIRDNIGDTAVTLKIVPQYGFILHYADQRIFPTDEPLYAIAGDVDFDELQNSTLDVGTPVAVLSFSLDDQWAYVESALSGGWVKKEQLAVSPVEQIKFFYNQPDFVVVTRAKADIFKDMQLTQHYDYARMGSRFAVYKVSDDNTVAIYLPQRGEHGEATFSTGYMRLSDLNQGYLPFTPRRVITQAFELLNEPYGWGGMYGEQDCSAFLDEIFATFGITLPRNSSAQRQVGRRLAEFRTETSDEDKIAALQSAPAGLTLLGMKGHIMLYLGILNGRPYAIHSVWAYREPAGENRENRIRVINRTAVTDLHLGQGSKKGSLLNRLTEIVEVNLEP
jgi:hypothetical protein